VLELRQIGKTYPGRRGAPWRARPQIVTLQPFDLRLNERESVAIVGESGSGKSTILRIAAGLLAPDSGEVFYAGAGRPQMVFQDATASLTPWLTIGEMVEERLRPSMSDHRRRTEHAAATLARVGLDPALMARRPAELSGGQNQRAAIARAIVLPPKVLLCDEPITAVDASLAAGLLNLLVELRHEFAMATLFVTHDLAAARYIAGRIIVLRKGEVVEDGPSDQVVTRPHAPYTRQLITALPENLAGPHGSH
jgi:peptide/nickel transport system ATP-binding protein